jgi:hypothetical protein
MFETVMVKWKKISTIVVVVRHYQHTRNGPTCKDKWGLLTGYVKKIVNYMLRTGYNQEYWSLTSQEKATFHLLRLFHKNFYE